jgi:twinkle protein
MLSEKHSRGLEDRSLSPELAADMGLYSGRLLRDGSIEPDENGNVLCIPYFEREDEVNAKYRWSKDGERRFMQKKDATKTVYNANVLLNEETLLELEAATSALLWTEGEFDTLAAIESGHPHTISVPDGAPPARDKNGRLIAVPDDDRDIDPNDDDKFAFMGRLMEQLQRVKIHIIATDGDEPGRRLAKELVRRIGAARCRWIEYPTDEVVPDRKTGELRACKDINEVKKYFGPEKVRELIELSKPWPVRGLFRLSDYPEQDLPAMCNTGISKDLDEMMKIYPGQFIVATGIPNVGKSTFWNQVCVQMAKVHKWPQAIFSGEKDVKPFLARELMTAFLEKEPERWTSEDRKRAEAFVERYFQFIDYEPDGNGPEIDVEYLLNAAATAVFRDGVKMLTIDPWNELEHERPANKSLTEYIGHSIKKMKRFGKQFSCAVAVVAHPTKFDSEGVPGLYNISDSAHWANKSDLGIVVHAKKDDAPNAREIHIKKVRLKRIAGNTGIVTLDFNENIGLFQESQF